MKGVWTIVQDVLTRHYSALSDTVEHCIDKVAGEMYSKELISKAVRNSPEYRTIHDEFVAGMKLKRDLCSLEKHCQNLLDSLIAVGFILSFIFITVEKKGLTCNLFGLVITHTLV